MSKKKIHEMTITEIFQEIGQEIDLAQIQYILIDRVNSSKLIKNCEEKDKIDFIKQNADNVDKERLAFRIAMNLYNLLQKTDKQQLYNGVERARTKQRIEQYERAIELLKDSKVEYPALRIGESCFEIDKFLTVGDFSGRKTDTTQLKEKNNKILKDIEENKLMIPLLINIVGSDFCDALCYYSGNGDFFEEMLDKKFKIEMRKYLEDQVREGNNLSLEERQELSGGIHLKVLQEILEQYSDKFDMEKLMLLSVYRAKKDLTSQAGYLLGSAQNDLVRLMQYVSQRIEDPKLKLNGRFFDEVTGEKDYINYSIKDLRKDVERIVEGEEGRSYYFSQEQIVEIRRKTKSGEMSLIQIAHWGVFPLLELSVKEKQDLIKREPQNFERLVALDALNKEEIQEALEHIEGHKLENIENLYMNGLIDKRDLINMYMRNNMNFNKAVDYDILYDLSSELTVQALMKYYFEMRENECKIKDFEKYALLFREVKIKGKSPEIQDEIAEQIVEKICETESEYETDFKNLYLSNLLPIKTLIDWNGEEILYSLISKVQLKPKDVKDLLEEQKLDLKKVNQALQNSDLSEEEKVNFIFSCLENLEHQAELLQTINVSEDLKRRRETVEENPKRQFQNKGIKRKENILNPRLRWQFISLIDEDWSSKVHKDGTVEFCLPNVNGGTVIMEKMMKKTKNGIVINYGAKTVLMSLEEFNKNKEEIIVDGKVNRAKLTDMKKEGTADGVIHIGSWGTNIMKSLGITMKSRYSEEKIEEMEKLCAQIDKDYQRQR